MRVIIESPFKGEGYDDLMRNIRYARLCLKDSLNRKEFPIASHLLYPQVLEDSDPIEREQGIEAGLEWGKFAQKTIVYQDYGISKGMQYGIDNAIRWERPVEYRNIL